MYIQHQNGRVHVIQMRKIKRRRKSNSNSRKIAVHDRTPSPLKCLKRGNKIREAHTSSEESIESSWESCITSSRKSYKSVKLSRHMGKEIEVLRLVNDLFKKALDFHSYSFAENSCKMASKSQSTSSNGA